MLQDEFDMYKFEINCWDYEIFLGAQRGAVGKSVLKQTIYNINMSMSLTLCQTSTKLQIYHSSKQLRHHQTSYTKYLASQK